MWRDYAVRYREEKMDVADLAKALTYALGSDRPPVDPERIAHTLEIDVRSAPASASWYGAAQADDDGAVVWLRENLDPLWRRFTLAHEIGHVLLHETAKPIRDIGFSKSGQEGEATRFAVVLFIPTATLEELIAFASADPQRLAAAFRVPDSVMHLKAADFLGHPIEW